MNLHLLRKRVTAYARRGFCCLRWHDWESWGEAPCHGSPDPHVARVPTRWCRDCLRIEQLIPMFTDGAKWRPAERLNEALRVTSLDV